MKHVGLFEGMGGFSLAARWMGWETIAWCEIDSYCQYILKSIFPEAIGYEDIKKTDFTIHRGGVFLLTGGDPCQPHSIAGMGKGKDDDRYLWPEMFRAIRECRPAWIINENVDGSISNGIVDVKINDLESEGYSCQAYNIPASSVGALHKRSRVWIVANDPNFYATGGGAGKIYQAAARAEVSQWNQIQYAGESVNLRNEYSNSDLERLEEQYFTSQPTHRPEGVSRYFGFGSNVYGNIRRDVIESGIIRMLNGLPEGMDYTERNKRIKAIGNSIVPQVAFQIMKAIQKYKPNV